ncbi:MAG: hypothetical protein KGP28_02060 [Bdellovibrionales bacterium]|nr:hypothetical protein [Bdellovibrionales bacterium]
MILLSMGVFFFGFYSMFIAIDSLEIARGAMRVLLVLVFVCCERFSEVLPLEGVVLLLVVIQMALYAFVRVEVRVENDRH